MSTAPPHTNGTTSSNSAKSRGQLKKLKKTSKAIALLSAVPETIESAQIVPAIIEIDEKVSFIYSLIPSNRPLADDLNSLFRRRITITTTMM